MHKRQPDDDARIKVPGRSAGWEYHAGHKIVAEDSRLGPRLKPMVFKQLRLATQLPFPGMGLALHGGDGVWFIWLEVPTMSLYGMLMAARTLSALGHRSAVTQHNLANQSTDGFKFDRIIASFDPATGAPELTRSIDLGQGSLLETGNPFHLALQGPGFFLVQTPDGPRLTRNGAFQLVDNILVDGAQRPVLGDDGPITIVGTKVEIGHDGSVLVDDKQVATIRLVDVPTPSQLTKEGVSLFATPAALQAADLSTTRLLQGQVEESNMVALAGIGDMIDIQRNFALTMGALQTMDSMLETVTNEIGRT